MKPYEFKESSVDASRYLPPLADDKNIQPRLIRLSALLGQICEKLVESMAAARALGIVDAMLALRLVNFDALMLAFDAVEEIFLSDSYPTTKETRCPELVKEAFDLAADILADVPIGYAVGENAPSAEELETMKALLERKELKAAASQLGCAGAEDESSNLLPTPSPIETTVLRGFVTNLQKKMIKKNQTIAIFTFADSYSIVALPRTWYRYGEVLSQFEQEKTYITIEVQNWESGEYGLMEILGIEEPENTKFKLGQRVRLTRDLPDEATPLYAGDEGVVVYYRKGEPYAFCSDRYESFSFSRMVDDEKRLVLDFCEPVEASAFEAKKSIAADFWQCPFCNAQAVNPQSEECVNCYASFKNEGGES